MVKRVRRIVSGETAVERICGESDPSGERSQPTSGPCMSLALLREWSSSRQLAQTFAAHGKNADMDVEAAAEAILSVKSNNAAPDVRANLKRCLTAISDVNALRADVIALRECSYDADDASHEDRLERLWVELQGNRQRQGGRLSSDWGDIGFQTRDPKSDFRGGGLLGLEQLLHIAMTRGEIARRMIVEPEAEEARYPWACAGINVTMEAYHAFVDGHALDATLYRGAERVGAVAGGNRRKAMLAVYHDVYADMFERLHEAWVGANPENVLAFGPIFKKVMAEVLQDLKQSGQVSPSSSGASGKSD